jgi:hypothetical protein
LTLSKSRSGTAICNFSKMGAKSVSTEVNVDRISEGFTLKIIDNIALKTQDENCPESSKHHAMNL